MNAMTMTRIFTETMEFFCCSAASGLVEFLAGVPKTKLSAGVLMMIRVNANRMAMERIPENKIAVLLASKSLQQ